MRKYIKWILYLITLFLINLQKSQCAGTYENHNKQNSQSNQDVDNQNNVTGIINSIANVKMDGNNENLLQRKIGPSITEFHIVMVVFVSIAASMLIVGGIIFSVYYMHKKKMISRKVLTGESTMAPVTRKDKHSRNTRTKHSRR